MSDFSAPDLYINRELSQLDFNMRVLQTARIKRLPILERVKFLAIFYSNLDEFYMVRVGLIYDSFLCGQGVIGPDGIRPTRLLSMARDKVLAGLNLAESLWTKELLPILAQHGLVFRKYAELASARQKYLQDYFRSEVRPMLCAKDLRTQEDFADIPSGEINLAVRLRNAQGQRRYVRVPIGSGLPKLLFVPDCQKILKDFGDIATAIAGNGENVVYLEDLVASLVGQLFPGETVEDCASFRITRNTKLDFDEDDDNNLMAAVRSLIERRRSGNVLRLEIAKTMSRELATYLMASMRLHEFAVYRIEGPQAFAQMFALYGVNYPKLKYRPNNAPAPQWLGKTSIFDTISQADRLVYHPYQSFSSVISFLQQAAEDPDVVAIKQTIYRVGKKSPIIAALLEANRRGKEVTAVVELKARFDEAQNIAWAEELVNAGVRVVYSPIDLKIHAKLCLVTRREGEEMARYIHIGTGNYNASTARLYTDLGLFTKNPEICEDADNLFRVMTDHVPHPSYKQLIVSPVGTRPTLLHMIEAETTLHKLYGDGQIDIKCNQLTDPEFVEALYKASCAGVRVRLQVRGACMIKPGVKGVSDNVSVCSIVGQNLEHARIYRFNAHGANRVFIGSADLMGRNLDRRIEVITPILDSKLAKRVATILDTHLQDNAQCWKLHSDGIYRRLRVAKGKKTVNSQRIMQLRAKQKDLKSF